MRLIIFYVIDRVTVLETVYFCDYENVVNEFMNVIGNISMLPILYIQWGWPLCFV